MVFFFVCHYTQYVITMGVCMRCCELYMYIVRSFKVQVGNCISSVGAV